MSKNHAFKIFLVDDDPFSLNIFAQHLKNYGYTDVSLFQQGNDCLNSLEQQPDIILLEQGLDKQNGLELLKKIKRYNPGIFVVFIAGQEEMEAAVNSLRYGAFDYIIKGFREPEKMLKVLARIEAVIVQLQANNRNFFRRLFAFMPVL